MDYLVIEGVKPYDGRYELDLAAAELTTREWGWIKRHSGYMPLTIDTGFAGGDPELFACLAVVALRRAGKIDTPEVEQVLDRIGDAPFGTTIRFESDRQQQPEDDAGPPASSSNGSSSSSGDGSTTSSEDSAETRVGSGTPGSATSGWPRRTSGS